MDGVIDMYITPYFICWPDNVTTTGVAVPPVRYFLYHPLLCNIGWVPEGRLPSGTLSGVQWGGCWHHPQKYQLGYQTTSNRYPRTNTDILCKLWDLNTMLWGTQYLPPHRGGIGPLDAHGPSEGGAERRAGKEGGQEVRRTVGPEGNHWQEIQKYWTVHGM